MDKDEYRNYILHSAHWRRMREQVLIYAHHMCQRCEKNMARDVHHLTYERLGEEELEDLQAICRECHEFIHGLSDYDPAREGCDV